jgi:esterase/lipase
MMWVEKSGHVIPREPERFRVFQAVQSFIERVCKVPV